MTDFLFKSTLSMAVLLGLYYILFEREKMHCFNRFYLLGALVLAIAVPFITVITYIQEIPSSNATTITTTTSVSKALAEQPTDYLFYIGCTIYSIVTITLAIRFIRNIISFFKRANSNPSVIMGKAKLVLLEEKILPHTFLNYIFVNLEEYEAKMIEDELYTHELTHVKQKHTFDILFIEALKIVFWFNPLLYCYKKAIQLNHEFLADEKVIDSTANTVYYQKLLLEKATVGTTFSMASNLTFSLTKKRFVMMTKTTSTVKAGFLKLAIAPVITALMILLCVETIAQEALSNIPDKKQETPAAKDKRRDTYYAGVRMIIEDKTRKITIDKLYEELTMEQKREYLFYVPIAKVKKSPTGKELEEYKNKSKYAIWIDGKNVDNLVLNKYKNTDFVYVTGSPVYKNAQTKQHPQPFQFNLYTNAYFDKNLKYEHLKYPSKVLKLSVSNEDKKKTATSKQKNQNIKSASSTFFETDTVTKKQTNRDQQFSNALSGVPSDKIKSLLIIKNVTQLQVDSLKQAMPYVYLSNNPKNYGKIFIEYTDENGNPARKNFFAEE
ncbi:M56 family metallopeptidase [Flavobacterium hauense]